MWSMQKWSFMDSIFQYVCIMQMYEGARSKLRGKEMKVTITEENGKQKIIGALANKVFKKTVSKKVHLLRSLDAWGIDAEVFTNVLMSEQCAVILIKDRDENKMYMTLPQIVKDHGEYKHYKPHRAQIFLARRYWAQSGDVLSAERIKEILQQNHVRV